MWYRQGRGRFEDFANSSEDFGSYRVSKILGQGGFGTVLLAHDEDLARSVAIKIPREDRFQSTDQIDLFFQEAKAVAGLEHPGIVTVYHVGTDDGGLRYIVSKYIEGQTLEERIKAGSVPNDEAAEIVRRVAEAVHFMHSHNIFHRDLKPANILLDQDGHPFVADFGLALHETQQLQHAGEIAGTLPYMPPEQVRGEAHRIDGRSDVWSLGVILYRLLTGRLPFAGKSQELMDEIQEREPRPPRQIEDSVPQELDRICLKCLSKPINNRYSAAIDLAEDLCEWLESSQSASSVISTSIESGQAQATAPSWRHWHTTIVVLSLAAIGLIATFSRLFTPSPIPTRTTKNEKIEVSSPFEIDSYAVERRWYPLLVQEPRVLLWPKRRPVVKPFDPDKQEISVQLAGTGLLAMGQTQSDSFTLQVTISKTSWRGSAGLFWGYKIRNSETQVGTPRCEAIQIVGFAPDKDGQEIRLERQRFQIVTVGSKRLRPDRSRLALESVDPPNRGAECTLEVVIREGELYTVKWNGVRLNELLRHDRQNDESHAASGQFGIVFESEAAVFHDARIQMVKIKRNH